MTAQPRGQASTDLRAILGTRWSCRAFLSTQVRAPLIGEMLAIAKRTASWCNTQPWHAHVVSDAAPKRFARSLTARGHQHDVVSDLLRPSEYGGVCKDRRREAGLGLYASLGIDRADRERRAAQHLRNLAFFGAPQIVVVTSDRNQGTYGAVDSGAYVANLLNAAATNLGIATIKHAAIATHFDHVRDALNLPDPRPVVCAVSFGYPDLDDPVNKFRTSRRDVVDAVTHIHE